MNAHTGRRGMLAKGLRRGGDRRARALLHTAMGEIPRDNQQGYGWVWGKVIEYEPIPEL